MSYDPEIYRKYGVKVPAQSKTVEQIVVEREQRKFDRNLRNIGRAYLRSAADTLRRHGWTMEEIRRLRIRS